jgi:leader peptidase (prepilin peptidase) / N-methyltransferase
VSDDILFLPAALYLVLVALAISVIDARRLMIPNVLNAAHLGGGLTFAALTNSAPLLSSLLGGIFGFVTLLAFRSGYRGIRGRDGLGLGDVKFMAGSGLWVGWQGLAPLLLASSLSALVFLAIRVALAGRSHAHEPLPFGPFLCAGTVAVWGAQMSGLAPWVLLP